MSYGPVRIRAGNVADKVEWALDLLHTYAPHRLSGEHEMSERKSPPGPREMVQEHKVIHTYSGIHFESEGSTDGSQALPSMRPSDEQGPLPSSEAAKSES